MMDRRQCKYRVPLALLLALLSGVPSLARNVECPAVWPGDSSKSKVKDAAVYNNDQTELAREESKHGIRVEDVVYGEYSICNAYIPMEGLYSFHCMAKRMPRNYSVSSQWR